MRVAQLDFADRSFPVSLVEVDEPDLPGDDWARVAVTGGGICGSDLHIFEPTTGPTPALIAYVAFPMELGHEVAGRVVQAGRACPVREGTRVAIDPVMGCVARGIEPVCDQCGAGRASVCRNTGSKIGTPGFGLGFTHGLGSGWGDEVLAHASMLHPLPDQVSDEGATLHEPLSIAIHGLLRRPPADGEPVLVMGAGIIGLCTVVAARHLLPASPVIVVAKHRHQANAAAALGATHVVDLDEGDEHLAALAELAGTHVMGSGAGAMLAGGFPCVVEAVGTARSVTEALRCVDGRGTVLLVGAAGVSEVDLAPVWFKEAELVGSFVHAVDSGPGGGPDAHSEDRALAILAAGGLSADVVVTHRFALDDLREAVATARDRSGTGAIKVVLHP